MGRRKRKKDKEKREKRKTKRRFKIERGVVKEREKENRKGRDLVNVKKRVTIENKVKERK